MPALSASRPSTHYSALSLSSILTISHAISKEGNTLRTTSFHALEGLLHSTIAAVPRAEMEHLPSRTQNKIRSFATALKGGLESWKVSAEEVNHDVEATDRLFSLHFEEQPNKKIRVFFRYDKLEEAPPCSRGDVCVHDEEDTPSWARPAEAAAPAEEDPQAMD